MIPVPLRIRKAARLSCVATLAAALAGSLFPHLGPSDANDLDKLAHVVGYAALTLQIGLGIRRERPVLLAGLVALIVGGGLELAQSWVPGRSGSWGDFVANALGVLAGMAVCHHALTIFKKRLLPSIH